MDTQLAEFQLQSVFLLLTHKTAHHEECGNSLREGCCKSDAGGAHVEEDNEQQVKEYVDNPGAYQVDKGTARIPSGAEQRIAEVVYHHERHSAEVDTQIACRHTDNAFRRGHQPEYLFSEQQTCRHEDKSADDAEGHCRVDCPAQLGDVLRAAVPRGNYVCADGKPDEQVRHEVYQRRV